ncbi:MAG: EVE domain-containing protein [Ignavibacteriaceae bacterium]
MKKFWIVAASKDHIKIGEKNGFTQANHGKPNALKKMNKDDMIIFYSSKEKFDEDIKYQKFTAIGKVADDEIYQYEMDDNFKPFRRKVNYFKSVEAPIQPIIEDLSFIKNKKSWGYPFRFGVLEIHENDFKLIEKKMLNK